MDHKSVAGEVERNGVLGELEDAENVNKTSRDYEQHEQTSKSHDDNLQSYPLSSRNTKENDKIESEQNPRRSIVGRNFKTLSTKQRSKVKKRIDKCVYPWRLSRAGESDNKSINCLRITSART